MLIPRLLSITALVACLQLELENVAASRDSLHPVRNLPSTQISNSLPGSEQSFCVQGYIIE